MKVRQVGIAILTLSLAGAGCARITTSVVEKPRVDQELAGGNRGYLVGTPPPSAPEKSTRQVFQTDIELATMGELTPWKRSKAEAPSPAATPSRVSPRTEAPSWEPPAEEELPVPSAQPVPVKSIEPVSTEAATTYTVKAGDTLEKIAAKVYGSSNQWRRIYLANKGSLSGPNRIYPGQKLVIPPAEEKKTVQQNGPLDDLK